MLYFSIPLLYVYAGLIFGHFSAQSTQLELAVFEFFWILAWVFSRFCSSYEVFFTKNTLIFLATVLIQQHIWFMSKKELFLDFYWKKLLFWGSYTYWTKSVGRHFFWHSSNCSLVELADFEFFLEICPEFFQDLAWVLSFSEFEFFSKCPKISPDIG